MADAPAMDIEGILDLIPHRYPFLLVDRVIELEDNQRAVGIKNVTINEHFFLGHFPKYRVMPGVLIVEALAQVGGIMSQELSAGGKTGFFAAIDNVRFKRPVTPGDQLRLEVERVKGRGGMVKMTGEATVEGELACRADLTVMFK